MRRRFACEVGLSDHALRPYAAYAATACGAVVIEKHLTLSRAAGGVDSAFSLEPPELQELATGIDLVWQSLGEVRYGSRDSERASLAERPSVYVVERVAKGEPFSLDNLRVIRPAAGLAPKTLPAILGRPARHDVAAGTPMSWELIDGPPEGGQCRATGIGARAGAAGVSALVPGRSR
jgi:N-acetylneuraminate synthase